MQVELVPSPSRASSEVEGFPQLSACSYFQAQSAYTICSSGKPLTGNALERWNALGTLWESLQLAAYLSHFIPSGCGGSIEREAINIGSLRDFALKLY